MARVWKFDANVDTDQIVPGRYAPYMRPDDDVGDFVFIEARPEFAAEAKAGDVIIAGENFGCGSSREYAPLAIKRRQIGAVIAASFARIFFRNAVNLGIPVFVAPNVVAAIPDGAAVILELEPPLLRMGSLTYALPPLPDFARDIVRAGGIVAYVRTHGHFPGQG